MSLFRPLSAAVLPLLLVLSACSTMAPSAPVTATAGVPGPVPRTGKTEVLWLGQATTRITTPGGK